MLLRRKDSDSRNGLVARQVIVYGIALVVVVAAGYEFLIARPAFQKVFDRITELDMSNKGINMTADAMEKEILQKKPVAVRQEELHDAEVRTYQWPSGIIFRPHTIHVIYSKGSVRSIEGESRESLYYVSSVANGKVTHENLPMLKETIMKNLNLKGLGMGGGGGGGGGGGNDDDSSSADDDDNSADDDSESKDADDGGDDKGEEGDPKDDGQPAEKGDAPKDEGDAPKDEGDAPKDEGDAPKDEGDAPKDEGGKDDGGGGLNAL